MENNSESITAERTILRSPRAAHALGALMAYFEGAHHPLVAIDRGVRQVRSVFEPTNPAGQMWSEFNRRLRNYNSDSRTLGRPELPFELAVAHALVQMKHHHAEDYSDPPALVELSEATHQKIYDWVEILESTHSSD